MKNRLINFAVKLLQKWISKHRISNRILVVSTTALGDTLWGTAAIENIKKSFPHFHLAVLTSSIGEQVLRHNPNIDQLYVLKEPLLRYFFSLWKKLYFEKFNTVLIFHASQRLILPLCALLGASKIVGTAGINKGLDSLLTHPLPNLFQHEIVRRNKIAESIGAKVEVETLSFFLQPNERLPKRGNWVAMHPGSKDAFKRWPAENFIKLGKMLKNRLSCEILITGTHEERKLMHQIAKEIPGAHVNAGGRSLREFAALLTQMDLLISNDTGPVHLACALGLPVVAIYSSTDPALCGPHLSPLAKVVSRKASCEPCLKRKCRLPFCFLQIGPEEVFQKVLELEELFTSAVK